MTAFRRILCPLDFSRFSLHALDQAIAVARESGAEVCVLHVFAVAPAPEPVMIGSPVPLEPMRLAAAPRAELLAQVNDVTDAVDAEGVTMRTVLYEGDPVTRILDYAADWDADLIVMGTHGRSGFERLLLGSVAEKVLRKAPCPVLTVPARVVSPMQNLTFARILCAVDFSPASLRAVDYAASLAAPGGPGVTVLNVVELFAESLAGRDEFILDTPQFRADVKRCAEAHLQEAIPPEARQRCAMTDLVTAGKAWKEILRVAAEGEVDLIVLGVEGRSTADLLLFGSTTQHVVRQATCPVLTVRA